MYCNKCGKPLEEGSDVCKFCFPDDEKIEEDVIEPINEPVIETQLVSEASSSEHIFADNQNIVAQESKKSKKRGALVHIGASFLSIIFAVAVVLTFAIGLVRNIVSPGTIQEMIKNVSISEIKVQDIAEIEVLEEYGFVCNSDNLLDIVFDNIDQEQLPHPISKSEFLEIVENENFQQFFGDIISEALDALTSGEDSDIISVDDLISYLSDNKEEISDILGYELTEERLETLHTTIDEKYGQVFEKISVKKLEVTIGAAPAAAVNVVFADWLFYALLGIDLLVAGLMLLVVRSVSLWTKYCGFTVAFVGMIYLCAAVALNYGALALLQDGTFAYIINQLAGVAIWKIISISIWLIILGIIIPVAVIMINHFRKRKAA